MPAEREQRLNLRLIGRRKAQKPEQRLNQAMESSRLAKLRIPQASRWVLLPIIGLSLTFHLWGIQRDLPFTPEVDEPIFVTPAVRIAASGDLNPGWFGNPGSTVIYPLAALYHTWYAVAHGGVLFHPDSNLQVAFEADPSKFYLLGRFLTTVYAVMSVPLVYQIGRRAFGRKVGLISSWLSATVPVAVAHANMVRTDSAAVFFGMLALWLCLRLYDHPTIGNQMTAGLVIGLAIATRYFMVALIPILLALDGLVLRRHAFQAHPLKACYLRMSAGLLAIPLTFALSTPYFFLDFTTVLENLRLEARSVHLGSDGLSPMENFWWYLTKAIPWSLAWPQTMLAIIGIALAIRQRRPRQMLLIGFALTYLVGISLSPLHWQRWVIQILPVLALLVASALIATITYSSKRLKLGPSMQQALIVSAILLVSAGPAYRLIRLDIRLSKPSTRILAREWILQNLPPGSRIAQEMYTAPLSGTDYDLHEARFLAATGYTLEDGYRLGIRYVVVSSAIYGRYMAEPDRYPSEIAFYQRLFSEGHLLQQFEPSATRGGPVIRVYELLEP